MVWKTHDYDNIPGTYVFDGKRSYQGYPMNKMLMSFNEETNRAAFRADEEGYCRKFNLSDAQRTAIMKRDWLAMIQLGANIYYVAKLATASSKGVQDLGAQMTGMTVDEFKHKLATAGDRNHG